jgi:hypothetical protein
MSNKVLLIKEPVWKSVIKDTYTFGCLFAMFYLNHKFCGGSTIINIAILLMIIPVACSSLRRNSYTIAEAKEELARLEKEEVIV